MPNLDRIIVDLRELLEALEKYEGDADKVKEIAQLAQRCYGLIYSRGGYALD